MKFKEMSVPFALQPVISGIFGRMESALHFTLKRVMDECFPSKTTRMSSREPPWMNPLAKILLKKKANLQTIKRGGCLVNLSERIDAVSMENRKAL